MENLNEFFKEKTAIVIAQRLSTVKNADQILFLDNGQIAEKGTHNELVRLKGEYYSLVKNQLKLEKLNITIPNSCATCVISNLLFNSFICSRFANANSIEKYFFITLYGQI